MVTVGPQQITRNTKILSKTLPNLRVHGIRHNNKYKIMSKTYPKSRVHCRYEITINQNYVKNLAKLEGIRGI